MAAVITHRRKTKDMTRAEQLRAMSPQLTADGWDCLCCPSKFSPIVGYDGWPLLEAPLLAGDRRGIGFVSLPVRRQQACCVMPEPSIFGRVTLSARPSLRSSA